MLFGFLGAMCLLGSVAAIFLYLGGSAAAQLGWRNLAEVYSAEERSPEGVIVHGCSGSIGMNTYRGSLVVTFAREGIHVAPGPWPLRGRSHPPILLPWSGVKSATRKDLGSTRQGVIQFRDDNHRAMTLIVPGPRGPSPDSATGWSDFAGR